MVIVMTAAAMIAAGMAFTVLMVVMVALCFRIIGKIAVQKRRDGLVRTAAHAAVQTDAGFRQRSLGASADTAADERIHMHALQHTRQRAMSAAEGVHYDRRIYLVIHDIINFELLRVAKMLKNLAVFMGYCNSHSHLSFRFRILLANRLYAIRLHYKPRIGVWQSSENTF